MKQLFYLLIAITLLTNCKTTRNKEESIYEYVRHPNNIDHCPIHNSKLFSDTVPNAFSNYFPTLGFDKTKTPYPKVGQDMLGCVIAPPFHSIIKYCEVCDSIYLSTKDTTSVK